MNSPLLPTSGLSSPTRRTPSGTDPADELTTFVAELGASGRPMRIGARTAGPPPELLEQMAAAGRLQQQLRERGEEIRFAAREPGRQTAITLHDATGESARSVSIAEAFSLLAGEASE
jgi:hypothetical protein